MIWHKYIEVVALQKSVNPAVKIQGNQTKPSILSCSWMQQQMQNYIHKTV